MRIVCWLTHRTVSAWSMTEAQADRLRDALPEAEVVRCTEREAFLDALPRADVAAVWVFEQAWLERAPRLRWLATPAAGKDYFRIDPPETLGLLYGSFHGTLMAETVAGMLLAASRGLLVAHRLQYEGADPWPRAALDRVMRPLRGSRVTILGFGRIGSWIGRRLKPFGVRLAGVKRAPAEVPDYFDAEDRLVCGDGWEALLPQTDHLVLALPGGEATDRILDRNRLARLPEHAYVYNVGRGNAIDEAALAEALHAGRLAGACLDVFAEEPLPADHPLRGAPNALLLPHASAIASNYLDLFVDELAERLRAAAREGEPEG